MLEKNNPLPKTVDELDAQLEDRFWDELQESRCRPVTERFEREYFNEAPRENVSPHLFAMSRDAVNDSARPQRSEDARNGIASAPITNRGATLYACPVPDSGKLGAEAIPPATQRIMGGYDGGVEVGFNGKWRLQTFDQLKPLLEKAREKAQVKRGGERTIELDGFTFQLQPHGGGKGVHYRYILEAGGTQVLIHANPEGDLQPVRIRYGAEALIGQNLFALHNRFLGWLDAIGFEVEKEVVSRVDLQVMVERPVAEFFPIHLSPYF